MRVLKLLCSAILALVGTTDALAIITSDAPGSHSVQPGTIAFGMNLDGVVSFEHHEFGGTIGTGVLISDRHILTAAHVAESLDPLGYQVRFYLSTGNLDVDLVPMQVSYPDRWNESARNEADLAILELTVDAPVGVPRYMLYGLDDEVGKSAIVTGHGAIGLGTVGGRDLINDLVLHAGLNRIEVRAEDLSDDIVNAAPGDMLVFDFDSGQPANNVLNLLGISSDVGFGVDEVGVYIGDSGGPLFIDGAIAGLNRAILGGLDGDYTTTADDGSWGELAFVTRVSSYQDFIMSATGGQAVIVPARGAWNIDGSGNWSNAANWTTGVPNGSGSPAVFGAVITSPRTVTVDIRVTISRIEFDNSHAYTLAGDETLTLDVTSGDAQINVTSGSHTVSAPLSLADNTVITVSPAASSLSITEALIAADVTLTKAGQGTLTLENIHAAGLSITGGRLVLAPNSGVSVLNSLSIGAGIQAVPEPATFLLLATGFVLGFTLRVRGAKQEFRKRDAVGGADYLQPVLWSPTPIESGD